MRIIRPDRCSRAICTIRVLWTFDIRWMVDVRFGSSAQTYKYNMYIGVKYIHELWPKIQIILNYAIAVGHVIDSVGLGSANQQLDCHRLNVVYSLAVPSMRERQCVAYIAYFTKRKRLALWSHEWRVEFIVLFCIFFFLTFSLVESETNAGYNTPYRSISYITHTHTHMRRSIWFFFCVWLIRSFRSITIPA